MAADGRFRLREIEIEGFKGFTKSQTIPLNGRHLFVVGRNALGKSSVIEAIRWNLFGSSSRPGEIVLNQWYTGTCRVKAGLETGTRLVRLNRSLTRGTGGKSVAELTDSSGAVLSITDTLPQLASVDAGEGMHVVYSAQFAALHRAAKDLKPFARTLYSYLGLSDVPVLLEELKEFISTHEEVEKGLGQDLAAARSAVESALADVSDQITRVVANAPWGSSRVPTPSETYDRIAKFNQELAGTLSDYQPPSVGPNPEALLAETEGLVARATQSKLGDLETERNKATSVLQNRQDAAAQVNSLLTQLEQNRQAQVREAGVRESILSGETQESIAEQTASLTRAATESALGLEIRRKGVEWYGIQSDAGAQPRCPICGTNTPHEEIVAQLKKTIAASSQTDRNLVERKIALAARLQRLKEVDGRLAELQRLRATLEEDLERHRGQVEKWIGKPQPVESLAATLARIVEKRTAALLQLEGRVADVGSSNAAIRQRLQNLHEEVRFHRFQDQERVLKARREQADRAQEALADFESFGESVRKIRAALESALVAQLKTHIPAVDDRLSSAFQALTSHPVFDRVMIQEDNLLELQLRVASSDDPKNHLPPEDVLNGQALSALELVPYFAFSELIDAPIEVHLLLLDDPTQAFDPEHIETLIAKLAGLGKRVQLIVATHEAEKFEQFVSKAFDTGSYAVVRFQAFDKMAGPSFVHADG